jgi:hypothetical protein
MVGPGRLRKVALIGSVKHTRIHAPFADPSWEIWAHNSLPPRAIDDKRVDRVFDLHPPNVFQTRLKCGRTDYYGWLKRLKVPVYMQKAYPEIATSVRYPLERIRAEWPLVPFGSQTAYMIALALSEGVTHIGLFGIHYEAEPERDEQRMNAELWVGVAYGRGVQVVIPDGCPIGRTPKELYGYDTHTPEKYTQRLESFKRWSRKPSASKLFDPSKLREAGPDEQFTPPPDVLTAWAAQGAEA